MSENTSKYIISIEAKATEETHVSGALNTAEFDTLAEAESFVADHDLITTTYLQEV
jgi:hypothetical protein